VSFDLEPVPVMPSPPVTAGPTMADLSDLLTRMDLAQHRMGEVNPHRALIGEAAWWLVNLAKRVVELQTPRDHGAQ
jgi:hypothetical protein